MEQTDESARLAALCLAAGDRDRAAVRAAQAMREGAGLDEAIDAAGGVGLAALPDQDGRYRCPELRCPRRAEDAGFCGVYLEPMVAAPWEVAVVMGLPGPGRDAAIERCLGDAPQPVVTVRDADRPLRPYGPYRPGIGPTVVAELEEDFELGYHAIDRLLAAGRRVLIVTKYWPPGLRSRFERRAIHLLRAGPILPLEIDTDLEVLTPEEGRYYDDSWTRPRAHPARETDIIEIPGGISGGGIGGGPAERAPQRVVNLTVVDGAGRTVRAGLPARLPYLVRVGIGRPRADSLLAPDSPAFPENLLPTPDAGWWLTAVLSRDGTPVADGTLFLPRTGEAFVCACAPGGPHTCADGDRSPELDLPALAPKTAGVQQLQLAIYLDAAAVQAFEIEAPVGGDAPPTAKAVFTLSRDLRELDRFGGRDVSIRLGDLPADRHYLVVNDAGGIRVGSAIADSQAGTSARGLRSVLFDRQLAEGKSGLISRYDDKLGKSPKDYLADLWAMAREGAKTYLAMFPDVGDRDKLAAALSTGDGPAVIQVALAEGSRAVVPWQLVYDLPIMDNAYVCPSVLEYGPGSTRPVPDRCPHADQHDQPQGTLCPFGFWGFAHVLEVPPSSSAASLAERTGADRPATVVVGLNEALRGADWDEQRAVLDRLGGASVITTTVADLRAKVLAGPDLLYFFCHGARVAGAGSAIGGLALDLGPGGTLTPEDVSFWASLPPRIRWAQRRPLVVLNGCYTGERLPETLTDFAAAFVQSTGAAGVLATEVTMEQRLAAYAMSAFVTAWASGLGVGAALRRVRWQLLALGNVMGLAYSPYCDADLRLP